MSPKTGERRGHIPLDGVGDYPPTAGSREQDVYCPAACPQGNSFVRVSCFCLRGSRQELIDYYQCKKVLLPLDGSFPVLRYAPGRRNPQARDLARVLHWCFVLLCAQCSCVAPTLPLNICLCSLPSDFPRLDDTMGGSQRKMFCI